MRFGVTCELYLEGHDTEAVQHGGFASLVELWKRLDAASRNQAGMDLYDPSRHEVCTAIVMAALRRARVLIATPLLWNGEHGSHFVRSIIEGHIVLRWLLQQDGTEMYHRFQEYGRGKQKLQVAHMQPLVVELGSDAPEELHEAIEDIKKRLRGEWSMEFLPVSVEGTFAGISLRRMAQEIGADDEYRHLYQPLSAASHAEWGALDNYVVTRCLNPLHRFHYLPAPHLEPLMRPQLVEMALSAVGRLVDDYRNAFAHEGSCGDEQDSDRPE